MNTDRWYYRVFQSAPDLIRALLLGSAATTNALSLDPADPGDRLYRFAALEIKELSHRLDGVLWPQRTTGCAETGSPEFPVVLLEVVVITPRQRHKLGPAKRPRHLRVFLTEVHWISLEELSRQPDLDPLLNLITLPVRPESELAASSS